MTRRRLGCGFAALVTLAALTAAACGGNGGADATPTAAGTAPTPLPEPTIQGNQYTFPDRGYSVTIPDGWTPDANSVVSGPLKVDSFFSGEEVDGVQTNIAVSCEDNPENVSLSQYIDVKLETLRQLDARDLERLGSLEVGGAPAEMVRYRFVRDELTISKVDVMFLGGKCAWTVSLTAAPSAIEKGRATLNEFLSSFQLLSQNGSSSGG
jgi:hypothetical protein